MKTIKILHLFAQSLDLYGDYKNITVLCQRIRESGNQAEVTNKEHYDALELDGYDMVYIGHGKARNLAAIAPYFVKNADKIRNSIENGQLWFVTGNARELFGKSFTTVDGKIVQGIGLFDYHGVETNQVFVSDMIAHPAYDENATVYGFVNRTAYLEGENLHPLFRVITGFSDGKTSGGTEGTHYKNFYGTWSMGPVLVRNPSFMKEILKQLIGDDYKACDFSLEQQALDLVLTEFKEN